MTSAAAKKIQAKRARRPVYLVVRKLMDPDTGEVIGALVPAHPIDQRLLKERKFHVNREVRAELKQPRNAAFHRLAHAVGHLLVDNVEAFRDLDAHAALKRVQTESGVCCEPFEIDLGRCWARSPRCRRALWRSTNSRKTSFAASLMESRGTSASTTAR